MTQTVVCDASAVVALLLDSGPDGRWSSEQLLGKRLAAPQIMLTEAANIIRRLEVSGAVSTDEAVLAHEDLLGLEAETWPYGLLGRRVWELRHNLTCYDAGYVAVAELTGSTLVTLDRRIARAPGLRCEVAVPDS